MTKEQILFFGVICGMVTVTAGIIAGPGVIIGILIGYVIAYVQYVICAKKPKMRVRFLPEIEYKYWEVKNQERES